MMTQALRVACSWCGKHMSGDPAAPLVSHGICPACLAKAMAELDVAEKKPCVV
jgi:hypothetical protein